MSTQKASRPPARPTHAERIISFLNRDTRLLAVNFATHGMRISASSFAAVGEAIENGNIHVKATRLGKAGEYWIRENILVVDLNTLKTGGVELYGAIVHEAVHAYQDIEAMRMTTVAAEYVAFIAQSIFEVNSGRKFPEGELSFAVQLAKYYTGQPVPYSSHQLASHFAGILPSLRDDHGRALYGCNGVYVNDGVDKKKHSGWNGPGSKERTKGSRKL